MGDVRAPGGVLGNLEAALDELTLEDLLAEPKAKMRQVIDLITQEKTSVAVLTETHFQSSQRGSHFEHVFSMARHNRCDEVERALEGGMPADEKDMHGNSVLIIAAQNNLKRMLKIALRGGADVNHQNDRGNTSLHYALAYGHNSLAEYLISKGADDMLENGAGLTPYDGIC